MSNNQRSLKEIVEIISIEASKGKEEIHQLINNKMDELGDFVTELGAAHIVAREMGVDLSSEPSMPVQTEASIDQLVSDKIPNVNIIGRIQRIYDPLKFKKKDGTEGLLISAFVEDKSGKIRVVFWDQKATELLQSNCKSGDPIRIFNGYTRSGKDGSIELHLGIRSKIQIRPSGIKDEDLPLFKKSFIKINEIDDKEIDVSVIGKITQIDDTLEFERSSGTKGQKRGIVIGDETGEIYINFWNEKVEKIEQFNLGDIIEIVGLSAKIGIKGFVELHSNRFTSLSKNTQIEDIVVRKGFIGVIEKIEGQIAKIDQIQDINKLVSTKGLIINVNPLNEFSRENGTTGKVRDLLISDNTGLIRIVLWDEKTQFITENDVDKTISILNGYIRKGKYSGLEVHCGNQTQIMAEEVDVETTKQFTIEFQEIADIVVEQTEVHIAGIITELGPIQEIITKDNENVRLQNLKIEDHTSDIQVTSWRENVFKLDSLAVGDRVAIYNAKTKEDTGYGIKLQITRNTIVKKALFSHATSQGFVSSLDVSNMELQLPIIQDIEDIDEGDDITIQATVVKLIEKQFVYPLCPECNKKVKKENDAFLCTEHGTVEQPINRILFTFVVNDGTGSINVLCAGKLAEIVIGLSADVAARMVEEQDSIKAPYSYLKSKDFVNSEFLISGKVTKNQFLNSLEIVAKIIERLRYNEATKGLIKQIYSE